MFREGFPKWRDSRCGSPSPKSAAWHPVIFWHEGSAFDGYGLWMPEQGYETGKWVETMCVNGNKLQGQVLYFLERQERPDVNLLK